MGILDKMNEPLMRHIPYRVTNGTFGVEIEAEGTDLPPAAPGWDVHKEGSLRGEAKEYVTVGAVTRDNLSKCMDYLKKEIDRHGSFVDENSHRASTHIHVNMQHNTTFDVLGSVVVFSLLEPVFMRLCGPNRDGNLFCLPGYDCGDLHIYIHQLLERMGEDETIGFFERGKYAALNLNPLRNFGTIEFRTFPCSIRKDQILEWADWCQQIVDIAKACDDKTFAKVIQNTIKNPMQACQAFFKHRLNELSEFEIYQGINLGAENAYEISRVIRRFMQKHERKAA